MKCLSYAYIGLLLALVSSIAVAQEDETKSTDPLDDPEALLDGGGGPVADAAVLMYFATVEEEPGQHLVLRRMIERLREADDPRVAPALEALLNRDGVYDRTTPYLGDRQIQTTQSRLIRFHLAAPATDAWFELTWPEMTEAQRVDAVLDTMRPDPDIHLVFTDDVMERAKQIEQSLRPAFYEQLLEPDIEYDWRSLWMGNIRRGAGRLLAAFPPDEAERRAILASPRTFPKLIYLGIHGPPGEPWAIDLFAQLMEENRDRQVVLSAMHGYAIRVIREPEEVKARYRPILLEHADKLIEKFREDRVDHWTLGNLFGFADTLFKYGKHEDTLALLIELRDFFDEYDPEQRDLSDRLKRALPPNISSYMENVEFRIDMWTEDEDSADG